MAGYSFAQLEELWINAGGPAVVAPIAAAIALAESAGNPNAINPTDNGGTQTSWGLWQISDGTHGQPVANILSPTVNAQQAVAKYKASGWAPWGTYASGAYLRFLPKGYVAPATGQLPSATGGALSELESLNPLKLPGDLAHSAQSIAGSLNAIGSLATAFLHDVEWLLVPSHWIRVFAFGFGVGALIPGVYMLSRAGSGEGDIMLAMGILLITAAGVLLFIAFHNLPASITDLGGLLAWISSEIRQGGSPATTTPAQAGA